MNAGLRAESFVQRGKSLAVLIGAAGVSMAAGLQPVGAWPLMILGLALFTHLIVKAPSKWAAAGRSFAVATVYFALTISYVGKAFMVDDVPLNITAVAAVIAMNSALHAPYWVVACFAAHLIGDLLKGERWLLFAVALSIAEWLRGSIMLGVPIGTFAMTWIDTPISLTASLVGVSGLNLLTVFAGGSLWVLVRHWLSVGADHSDLPERRCALGLLVVLGVGSQAYASWHVERHRDAVADGPFLRVALAQTARRISVSDNPDFTADLVEFLLHETARAVSEGAGLVVWPETALPVYIEEDRGLRERISRALSTNGRTAVLASGSLRLEQTGNDIQYFNSVLFIDATGAVVQRYDKRSFVPYGETIPRPFRLMGFEPLAGLSGLEYTPGTGPRTVALANLPRMTPIICFEGLLPRNVGAENAQSDLLLMASNDGYFADTIGMDRVFNLSRMRTIELGMPMVRSAATGRTAIIDALGTVTEQLALYERGMLVANASLHRVQTLYARVGDVVFLILSGIVFGAALWAGRAKAS